MSKRYTGTPQEPVYLDPHKVAAALGGKVVKPHQIHCPGPGGLTRGSNNYLTVWIGPQFPDGFSANSHAGDPHEMIRDYVKERLGLEWRPRATVNRASKKGFDGAKFAWHWHMLGDRVLKPTDRIIAGYLMHKALHSEGGKAFPSQETIADDLGLNRYTVTDALQRLSARLWIKINRHGVKRPNTYELTCDPALVKDIQERRAAQKEGRADRRNEEMEAAKARRSKPSDVVQRPLQEVAERPLQEVAQRPRKPSTSETSISIHMTMSEEQTGTLNGETVSTSTTVDGGDTHVSTREATGDKLRGLHPARADTEALVLSYMLQADRKLAGERFAEIGISDDAFFDPLHRAAWQATAGLVERGFPVIALSVAETMTDELGYSSPHGDEFVYGYLTGMAGRAVPPSEALRAAATVRENADWRASAAGVRQNRRGTGEA